MLFSLPLCLIWWRLAFIRTSLAKYFSCYLYTETCKKYSVTVIFYYIFHIKPQLFKTLFQSQFLFDFDDIFTNRSENICSLKYFFEAQILNIHDLNTNLNYLSSNVLSLYCVFCFVFNSWTHKIYRLWNYAKITV
jgi:hypothetical protein